MDGKSPITKTSDKIVLMAPNILQQMTSICIIGDLVLIPFSLMLYQTTESAPLIVKYLWIFALTTTLAAFGFKKKYIFDTSKEQIFCEGTFAFIPYRKYLYNFTDIAEVGVRMIRFGNNRGGPMSSYFLVFSAKKHPGKYHYLATSEGINHKLNLNDINKLGKILSEILKCPFKVY